MCCQKLYTPVQHPELDTRMRIRYNTQKNIDTKMEYESRNRKQTELEN